MEREFNTAEVTAAVKIHLAACLMDDVARELGRVLTRQQRRGVLRRAEGLHTLYISIHSPHTGRDCHEGPHKQRHGGDLLPGSVLKNEKIFKKRLDIYVHI